MPGAPKVSIALEADEGVFFDGDPICGEVRLDRARRVARLLVRFQWRVRGSGELASDAYEIDVLAPLPPTRVARRVYPFQLPRSVDRTPEAPHGWYTDARFEGWDVDGGGFEVVANILVLPAPKRGPEQIYR